MIDKKMLNLMKTTAFLINVARGSLINENDLYEAIKTGSISGAALDVFEIEPLAQVSPLKEYRNIILGSHNANNMIATTEQVHKNTLKNLFDNI